MQLSRGVCWESIAKMAHFDPVQLAAWCRGMWQGQPPQFIAGITQDSRSVHPGDLYVALCGERLDGHQFVSEARQRSAGAALVQAEFATATRDEFPLLVVEDTLQALTELARGHRSRCKACMVGVTGSVGKTSVKEMVADVLSHLGRVTRTHGNWNNHIGLPLSMLRMEPTDHYGVFEVGMNHPGELAPLCELLRPDVGVLTPIGPVHIENFDSVADIAREKATLLQTLTESGQAILSLDDPWFELLRERVGSRCIVISMERSEADYYGEWHPGNGHLLHVRERATGIEHRYPMPLPGRYVADNALRAIAVGREMGLSPDIIGHAIAAYQPLSMRWQVEDLDGVRVVNDAYNANPISMRSAIEALQESYPHDRLWLVVGGMFELGQIEPQEHAELGYYITQFRWAGVVTVGGLGRQIAAGIAEAGTASFGVVSVPDPQAAADELMHHLQPGDTVLLKASRGEKLEHIVEHLRNREMA